MKKPQQNESLSESETTARMERAIGRSFQLPLKPHKEMRYPRRRKTKSERAEKPEIRSE